METRKEHDWTGLLQLLGLTLLLLTVGLWQMIGPERFTFVIYMAGCFLLFCASLAAIRAGSASSRCRKNTLFLLALELASGFYLYTNAREVVAATGYHMVLILAGGLIVAAAAQAAQLFLVRPRWTLSKARGAEILLVGALCVVFGFLLNIECFNTWTRQDSHAYFRSLERLSAQNIFRAKSDGLIVCGHASASYALWALLFRSIPGITNLNSLYLSNMALIAIDLALFYLIFKRLFPQKRIACCALYAVVSTVTPWFLGSVSDINAEHLLVTGVMLLLYAVLSGNELLGVLAAFIICGTRETGTVVAVVFIIMQFLYELVEQIRRYAKISKVNWAYYLLCFCIGLMWLLQLRSSRWVNGERAQGNANTFIDGTPLDRFGFNWLHTQSILKTSLLDNFKWVFLCLILTAFFLFFFRCGRKREKLSTLLRKKEYLIVGLGLAAFVTGLCSYITYNISRYHTVSAALLSILGICAIHYILETVCGKRILGYTVTAIIGVLLCVESYTTIDPVTKAIYPTMSTGNSVIASLPQYTTLHVEPYFDDRAVYNRQGMYYTKALDKAYAAIDAASDGLDKTKILCSNEYVGNTEALFSLYEIWGYGYSLVDPPMYGQWDRDGGYRYLSYEPPEHSIDPVYVGADTDLTDILNSSEHVYYIEMPWWDTVIEPLQERYPSIEPFDTIEYRGWVLNIYQVK